MDRTKRRDSGLTLTEVIELMLGQTFSRTQILTDRNERLGGAGEASDGGVMLTTHSGPHERKDSHPRSNYAIFNKLEAIRKELGKRTVVGIGPEGQYPKRIVCGYEWDDTEARNVLRILTKEI